MDSNGLETLSKMLEGLSEGQASKAGLSPALKALVDGSPFTAAVLLVHQPQTDRLVPAASAGLSANSFRRLESRADKSGLREIFDSGMPGSVSAANCGEELRFLFDDGDCGELLVSPVIPDKTICGVLATSLRSADDVGDAWALARVAASLVAQNLRVESTIDAERSKIDEERSHLRQELRDRHDFSHIVGNSGPMRLVYEQVTQVARSNATVLLRGESGTGKEMIAQAIHYNSLRAKGPFVKVNCAALPDTLVESELFGYEKGAFTGADKLKKGRFELADGGTIFLDEIGDLPPQTQIKLLRVLQEREFERLGGTETRKVNVRVVTATNRDLEREIGDGRFREDLYYRLNVFTIFLPPLRDRKADILLLAEHFLDRFEKEHGKSIKRISTPAIDMLTSYHFPGNVRELENVIERAVLVCDSNVIHGHHLPPTLQTAEVSGTETRGSLESAVGSFEKDLIQDALKSTGGNVAKAARALESTERIIGYKIRKYGLDPARYRS
jgi:Nif-specific regulatory protein